MNTGTWRMSSSVTAVVAMMLALLLAPMAPALAGPAKPGPAKAAVVRLDGRIDDYARDQFIKRFNQARAAGATVILIDLDTNGGLVTAGLDLSRFLKSQTGVHTIAYIQNKALSAGAMLAISCNEIVMSPYAQLGDCAPIAMKEDGSLQSLGAAEREKSESPIRDNFLHSAVQNGYDPLLVQAMVSMQVAVHWVQSPAGERQFVDEKTAQELFAKGWAEVRDPAVPTPLDTPLTLLTVSGSAAARLGLASETQSSWEALAKARSYTIVATYAPSAGDKLIEWLNLPWVRMLLIILLAQALYAALHVPGHGFAEVLAVVALALLVGVPLLTGYAQWWEIVLILVGVGLLAMEIFVIPGFGVAGVLGILLLVFGLIMTFVGQEPAAPGKSAPILPTMQSTRDSLRMGLAMVVSAMIASMVLFMWMRKFLPKVPYFNRLILTAVAGGESVTGSTTTSIHTDDRFIPVVGAIGEATTDMRPGGSATFYDSDIADVRVLSVICTEYIHRGNKVVVVDNKDNRILVRPEKHEA